MSSTRKIDKNLDRLRRADKYELEVSIRGEGLKGEPFEFKEIEEESIGQLKKRVYPGIPIESQNLYIASGFKPEYEYEIIPDDMPLRDCIDLNARSIQIDIMIDSPEETQRFRKRREAIQAQAQAATPPGGISTLDEKRMVYATLTAKSMEEAFLNKMQDIEDKIFSYNPRELTILINDIIEYKEVKDERVITYKDNVFVINLIEYYKKMLEEHNEIAVTTIKEAFRIRVDRSLGMTIEFSELKFEIEIRNISNADKMSYLKRKCLEIAEANNRILPPNIAISIDGKECFDDRLVGEYHRLGATKLFGHIRKKNTLEATPATSTSPRP